MVGNPFYTSPAIDSLRVSTTSGICGDLDGCSLTEANESVADVLRSTFFGWNGGPNYEPITSGGTWDVWTGFWSSVRSAANGLNLVLQVPR